MMEMSAELTAAVLENILRHGKFNIPTKNAMENAVRILRGKAWTMIEDGLPEDCVHVLVYFERNAWIDGKIIRRRDIENGWHVDGKWHVDGCSGVVGIAWMPLPDAPGEMGYIDS